MAGCRLRKLLGRYLGVSLPCGLRSYTHPTEKRYLFEGLGTFSAEYTKTSPKRAWFLLLTKLCAALRVSSQFNFAELYVSRSVQFVVSCCAALNHFRRDGSHKEKSLCSDYPENVGQNRTTGIRSYNVVCKFLDSSETHALRRQHEPKKYNCSGQRTNIRSCSSRMPIFDKNFPGPRHGCTRHEYSRIL